MGAQIILGTPLFSADVFQWAGFRNDPGRLNISCPLISFRMVQYIFEKCAETPPRGAIGCCGNIPDFKKRHAEKTVQFNGDDRSMVR